MDYLFIADRRSRKSAAQYLVAPLIFVGLVALHKADIPLNGFPNLLPMPDALRTPLPPDLAVNQLPAEERPHALALSGFMNEMRRAADDYTSAVLLRDYCNVNSPLGRVSGPAAAMMIENSLWVKWSSLAASSAVISARNYLFNLVGLNDNAGKAVSWRGRINTQEIKLARKGFEARFPDAQEARNATLGHPENHPEQKMAIPDNPGGVPRAYLRELIGPKSVTSTWWGDIVSCEVSIEAAEYIRNNAKKVYDAFAEVAVRA